MQIQLNKNSYLQISFLLFLSFLLDRSKELYESKQQQIQTAKSLINQSDAPQRERFGFLAAFIKYHENPMHPTILIYLGNKFINIGPFDLYQQFPAKQMFEARLDECSIFRKIIDSLKELVKMVNIQVNTKGLSIQAMDSCHVALVSLLLKEKAFSHYTCHKPLTLGLTIENVAKILKIAGNEDSMTLQCQEEPTSLKFRFQSKRGEKISEFNLSLMNLDSENLGIPQTEFSSVCTLPSTEFNRICRQFGSLSETIKIQTNKECVKFSITGEVGTGNAVLNQRQTGDDNQVTLEVDEPVSLSFAARYLNLFSKASGLSTQVTLHMSSQTPLMVQYKLQNGGGELKYYLAPKITEQE